jgi:tRNA threonylcarbamoyladenosine biosynthesis protein TsaE
MFPLRKLLTAFLFRVPKRVRQGPTALRLCSERTKMLSGQEKREQNIVVRQVSHRDLALPTSQDTWLLGAALARLAQPGDVLFLQGGLGAGKTTLARGFIQTFMNDDELDVVSPTYLLDLSYPDYEGRAIIPGSTIHHLDLYRLRSADERPIADFDVIFAQHICLVEWPDRLGKHSTPDEYLSISLSFLSGAEGPRKAALSGFASPKCRANPRWSQTRIDQLRWPLNPRVVGP